MKKVFIASLLLVLLASCDITVIEPRYDYRDRLVGYYDVEEYSQTYNDYTYYSLHISKEGSSGYTIYLDNFYAADISVYAYVEGDKITIPYQTTDGFEIEGTGLMQGNNISLTYRVKDRYHDTRTDFCELWGSRD
jgi:hypothetical protein